MTTARRIAELEQQVVQLMGERDAAVHRARRAEETHERLLVELEQARQRTMRANSLFSERVWKSQEGAYSTPEWRKMRDERDRALIRAARAERGWQAAEDQYFALKAKHAAKGAGTVTPRPDIRRTIRTARKS